MRVIRGAEIEFIPASHEDPLNPGVSKKVLVNKDDLQVGRVQVINWAKLPKGKSFQAHYHEEMTEVFVIFSGKAMIEVDQRKEDLSKGDAVIIEPREIHIMENVSKEEDVEYMVVSIVNKEGGKTIVV
jgi:mannose-6-phosphate isomerase-like protein (cupin superfamily)